MYYVNISGIEDTAQKETLKTIGPFDTSDEAINQGELVASAYYRVNYLELVNQGTTEIIWNLDE